MVADTESTTTQTIDQTTDQTTDQTIEYPVVKTEDEWKAELTSEEFYILREFGTEPSYSGDLLDLDSVGIYICAGCDHELFKSDTKFESGTGWPSFWSSLKAILQIEMTLILSMLKLDVIIVVDILGTYSRTGHYQVDYVIV